MARLFLLTSTVLAVVLSVIPRAYAENVALGQDPDRAASAAASNLTGTWQDPRGNRVEITQTGNQVSLRTSSGLTFQGSLAGSQLSLSYHYPSVERMPAKWRRQPPPIRERLNQMGIRLEGTVSPDGRSIEAEFITPGDVTYDPDTLEIEEITEARSRTVLTRELPSFELRFVRPSDAGFEGLEVLNYREPFFVEVRFDDEPADDERTVRLDWGAGSGKEVVVSKTSDDPKVFRSGLLYLVEPEASEREAGVEP